MLSSRPFHVLVVLLALGVAGSGVGWAGQDAGSVKLAKPIKYQAKTIDKGVYKVSIEDATEGPTLVLATPSGEVVVSELAIVQETKRAAAKPRASIALVQRGGPFVRLLVTAGSKKYWAFFEPSA